MSTLWNRKYLNSSPCYSHISSRECPLLKKTKSLILLPYFTLIFSREYPADKYLNSAPYFTHISFREYPLLERKIIELISLLHILFFQRIPPHGAKHFKRRSLVLTKYFQLISSPEADKTLKSASYFTHISFQECPAANKLSTSTPYCTHISFREWHFFSIQMLKLAL